MRFFLPFLLVLVVSCNQSSPSKASSSTESKVPTDSLINAWNRSWNNHDSVAIASQLTDDAVMLSGAKTMNGRSEIANKFISHFYKSMLNLQTQKVYEQESENLAVQAGTYSHEIKGVDSTQKTLSGGFTFIWERQDDKSWKIRFLELE